MIFNGSETCNERMIRFNKTTLEWYTLISLLLSSLKIVITLFITKVTSTFININHILNPEQILLKIVELKCNESLPIIWRALEENLLCRKNKAVYFLHNLCGPHEFHTNAELKVISTDAFRKMYHLKTKSISRRKCGAFP